MVGRIFSHLDSTYLYMDVDGLIKTGVLNTNTAAVVTYDLEHTTHIRLLPLLYFTFHFMYVILISFPSLQISRADANHYHQLYSTAKSQIVTLTQDKQWELDRTRMKLRQAKCRIRQLELTEHARGARSRQVAGLSRPEQRLQRKKVQPNP